MATYRKHGKKKKTRAEKIEQQSSTAKVFKNLDYAASSFEDWVSRNRAPIFSIIGVVIIGILGYLAYDNFIVQPRQEEAVKEIGEPMDYYTRALQVDPGSDQDDLFEKALNGSGGYGFLDIIDNYSGTDAANIAQYSAGIAYYNLKDYKKAVDYLGDFKSKDEILTAMAEGVMGDAFLENDQPEEALKHYKKAAEVRTNDYSTPKYLLKAGMTALDLDQKDQAKKFLEKIEEDYPDSAEATRAAVYLGMANK